MEISLNISSVPCLSCLMEASWLFWSCSMRRESRSNSIFDTLLRNMFGVLLLSILISEWMLRSPIWRALGENTRSASSAHVPFHYWFLWPSSERFYEGELRSSMLSIGIQKSISKRERFEILHGYHHIELSNS